MDLQLPLTPYAGTSGWSGSDTSRDRAIDEDRNGTTSKRQQWVLEYLDATGFDGSTWKELAEQFDWHHGQASGVLSVLHKQGLICRLKERRSRCKVYVLPKHVHMRPIEPHERKRQTPCPNCGHEF